MKRLAATLVLALLVSGFHAGAAAQGGAVVPLPAGPGRDLVATTCVGCHTLDIALSKRAAAAEWRATIDTMVSRGAPIAAADAAVMAAYLAQHYGPGAPAAAEAATLPDGPGKDVLVSKCSQCHGQAMWNDLRQDRRAWEGVLYRMVGRRALWTAEEIDAMAGYLARVRGPRTAGR
jgi:cytochrome c5